MSGKVSGHGKPATRPSHKRKHRPIGRVTHLGRRLRATTKHRANQQLAHRERKQSRRQAPIPWMVHDAW